MTKIIDFTKIRELYISPWSTMDLKINYQLKYKIVNQARIFALFTKCIRRDLGQKDINYPDCNRRDDLLIYYFDQT
jgi:hypothetical protein